MDLEAIKVVYFQECDERLGELERGLLALEAGDIDRETIDAVFRAVHSIKGGAGAFGFDDLVAFAHAFENVLDDLRAGRLAPETDLVRAMLRAADVLADLVQAAKTGGSVAQSAIDRAVEQLTALAQPKAEEAEADEFGFTPRKVVFAPEPAPQSPWVLQFRLEPAAFAHGHDAVPLLRELERLGPIDVTLDAGALPDLGALEPEGAYLAWRVVLPGHIEETAIRDAFEFVGDDCPIILTRQDLAAPPAPSPEITPAPRIEELSEPQKAAPVAAKPQEAASIRVNLDRVDRLINLVGELVINQAMLAQRVEASGHKQSSNVALGLTELEHLTRELQDSVMAIRAQPVRSVFARLPRLVRELAAALGKEARLVTAGEATEVDKTVIEQLADPLTHMIRNALDHGLEPPDERAAAGKPREGTILLSAEHRSGRIAIEMSDDGRGVDRARVRARAVERGLIAADAELEPEEIDQLIFLPGFSTAEQVSNISGRGVGMDVVKRNIEALGGRVHVDSRPGRGARFTLSLPLTLAVLDGMVVAIGAERYVVPLAAIIESLRPRAEDLSRVAGRGELLAVRGEYVPLVSVGGLFGVADARRDPTKGLVVLVEIDDGEKLGLIVDEMLGQAQVVIKSLEANYGPVEGVAAATILGDGQVALILDVAGLRRMGARRGRQQRMEAA